ncbi:MAG: hypothetical protein B7733_20970 [Myxococcales bacterium FL481]|nr:MAG: hypothetical protein B7733_20970 [Myxococcales bacterium FL481]
MAPALVAARRGIVVVLLLLLASWAAYAGRRAFIQAFFRDAAPALDEARFVPAPASPRPAEPSPLARTPRVRVLLLDGLGRAQADQLPALTRHCTSGVRLTVDVGFPTVSLPVQHVLWTGLTQQQTGIGYRLDVLEEPPAQALPPSVAASVAVAESHREIVDSFGFSRVEAGASAEGGGWEDRDFAAAARAAVAGSAALVFVHVLRIDGAGHRHGAESAEYADAADWSDHLLEDLVAADPAARWFVLSDHGHRPEGGHGGAEREVRIVQGCLFGAGIAADRPRDAHLVDVSRWLFDSLGVPPSPAARGREWGQVSSASFDATLPVPGLVRWALASFVLFIAAVVHVRTVGGYGRSWPIWAAVAVGTVLAGHGQPTLSHPMVYPPLGRDMHLAAAPGYVVLVATLAWRRRVTVADVVGQLIVPVACVCACLVLCGAVEHVLSEGSVSVLMPKYTAWASLGLAVVAGGSLSAALGYGAAAIRHWFLDRYASAER